MIYIYTHVGTLCFLHITKWVRLYYIYPMLKINNRPKFLAKSKVFFAFFARFLFSSQASCDAAGVAAKDAAVVALYQL